MKFLSKYLNRIIGAVVLLAPIATAFSHATYSQKAFLILLFSLVYVIGFIAPVKVRPNTFAAGFVTQYGQAEAFKRVRDTLLASGLDAGEVNNAVLSQSYLRLEQPLTGTGTVFRFPVLVNAAGTAPIRPTEVRLNQQDAFFVTNIAFYIAKAASATDTNFQLKTYPAPVTFTAGALNLYGVYNGSLQITINKSVIVPEYPMSNFLQLYQTQATAATNSPNDQFDPAQVSLWEPYINLIGTKESNIQINLPGATGTLDNFTYGVFILQGVLAQNVTLMS